MKSIKTAPFEAISNPLPPTTLKCGKFPRIMREENTQTLREIPALCVKSSSSPPVMVSAQSKSVNEKKSLTLYTMRMNRRQVSARLGKSNVLERAQAMRGCNGLNALLGDSPPARQSSLALELCGGTPHPDLARYERI
jgi:hypothetical protein